MSEFILERNGCPIHYWLEGDPSQPLVVFTHAAGADHQMFDEQVLGLQRQYQTLTWDVRGHGRSRPMGQCGGNRQTSQSLGGSRTTVPGLHHYSQGGALLESGQSRVL